MQQTSQHPVGPSEASDTANPRRDPAERFPESARQLIRPQWFVSRNAPSTAQRRALASLKCHQPLPQRESRTRRFAPYLVVATFLITAIALFGIWSLYGGNDTKVASQVGSAKAEASASASASPATSREASVSVDRSALDWRSSSSRGDSERFPHVNTKAQAAPATPTAAAESLSAYTMSPGLAAEAQLLVASRAQPGQAEATPAPESQPVSESPKDQQVARTYTVQDGDTIWGIAVANGVSVNLILSANSISEDDVLALGRELTIPAEGEPQPAESPAPEAQPSPSPEPQERREIKTYTVQPGDTLSAIAAANGVSVDTILWANNLDEDAILSVGQELTIPPTSGVIYSVQEGDTLQSIAEQFGVDAQSIADYNGIADSSLINIGMKLVIPGGKPAEAPAPKTSEAAEPPVQSAPSQEPSPTLEPQPAAAPQSTPEPEAAPPESTPVPEPTPTPEPAPAPTPAATEEPAPADGTMGQRIVEIAKQYIGAPYVWGGTTPRGFDCTGFVYFVYKTAGVPIPRDIGGQLAAGPRIDSNDLLPGDVVYFQNTYKAGLSHVGIYVGGGSFIHAVSFGVPVKIDPLWSSYYSAHYYGANRPW